MRGQSFPSDKTKEALNQLKGILFDTLKSTDIDIPYYDFLIELSPLVSQATQKRFKVVTA
jgi:hypothetical protein